MASGNDIHHLPVTGGTAPRNAVRTARKLAKFANQFIPEIIGNEGTRHYLDVGCGNGFITGFITDSFTDVYGIDTEPVRLEDFIQHVSGKSEYHISRMSAQKMTFDDGQFDFITSFEVLEHVSDLEKTADEIVRVLSPGGILVISVPQVWFPFENHGIRWRGRNIEKKIPLLPYLRPLHRRLALARVFRSDELLKLFGSRGLDHLKTAYIAPQFERAGSRKGSLENRLSFLRSWLTSLEKVPFLRAVVGVSLLMALRKPSAR